MSELILERVVEERVDNWNFKSIKQPLVDELFLSAINHPLNQPITESSNQWSHQPTTHQSTNQLLINKSTNEPINVPLVTLGRLHTR